MVLHKVSGAISRENEVAKKMPPFSREEEKGEIHRYAEGAWRA
jgi:hypothetical protein